jgi:hypothetical protein
MTNLSDIDLSELTELNFIEYPVGKLAPCMVICYGKDDAYGLAKVQTDALDECNYAVIKDVVFSGGTTLVTLSDRRYLLLNNNLKYSASMHPKIKRSTNRNRSNRDIN